MNEQRQVLQAAARMSIEYLETVRHRPVAVPVTPADMRSALQRDLPEHGRPAEQVLEELVAAASPGIVASAGPRYFGFVIGGALPVAVGADWLTSAWDQNACFYAASPAAAAVEVVTAQWLTDLLSIPATSFGFTTGAQGANTVALTAARHHVLAAQGWDVSRDGLRGAPPLAVLVGADRHATIDRALRWLGLGSACLVVVDSDEQGRMRPDSLRQHLDRLEGAVVVCAQAGNVNTGACDPFVEIAAACDGRAWLHVDGAFGLWAGASASTRHLVAGVELADSWSVDLHKWLNVPHDAAMVFTTHAEAHRAATGVRADYIPAVDGTGRDPSDWVPEFSRRARAFPAYAALQHLGREGVSALVERCCAHARQFAELIATIPGATVLNDVVLNQVVFSLADQHETTGVMHAVQHEGATWMGPTVWRGAPAIRFSVANGTTTSDDVEQAVQAVARAVDHHRQARPDPRSV